MNFPTPPPFPRTTFQQLSALAQAGQSASAYNFPTAFGIGVRRRRRQSSLDVWFPHINYRERERVWSILHAALGEEALPPAGRNSFVVLSPPRVEQLAALFFPFWEMKNHLNTQALLQVKQLLESGASQTAYSTTEVILFAAYNLEQPVASCEEAYFRLQLLSQRKIKPPAEENGMSLDALFTHLPNLAWTNYGPFLPEDLALERFRRLRQSGATAQLMVTHLDKFPYLVQYHLPAGVRIADGSRVRLGAYLASGTTVMPAGFVNFNAGTLGKAMVEGRISAGVVVGENTDLGGGASIMGTLSGGGKEKITIGAHCLLGANSGTGISLGDGCTVAAGLYLTAGTKVFLYNQAKKPIALSGAVVAEGENQVKALRLSGRAALLFFTDSTTGRVVCVPNKKQLALNQMLHQNT